MRFRLDKVDWKALSENRRLKFDVGLAVVLILFFAFFIDIIYSICRFKYYKEERPREKAAISQPVKKQPAVIRTTRKAAAVVAIILDDAGGSIPDYAGIRSIKEPLTVSILPHLPGSLSIARQLKDAGIEIMLHMPMEADNGSYTKRDGGMIITSASDDEIKKEVLDDFSSVKWAVGFNNHMGSKATKDERVMRDVFESVKHKGVFFIDSRTSGSSIAMRIAKSIGMRSAENNVFLDGGTSEADIEGRFRQLISMARWRGSAIGIGHATRRSMISVLKRLMPEYAKDGIKFVYASELAK